MKNKKLIRFWVNPESGSKDVLRNILDKKFDKMFYKISEMTNAEAQKILGEKIREQASRN